MRRPWHTAIGSFVAATLCAAAFTIAHADPLSFETETYTLPNGLTVTLHEDHTLPQVVVNVRVGVGSKDERDGRSGFAHLFEHLMFMGTERVPNSQFDVIMESGGGWNNAWTSADLTNYYSVGPSALLPTLLWLDADRFDALSRTMTQEKLDLQRDVVRNERREGIDNEPYGIAEILIAETLYPDGHPYHHTTIGSHEDLEAATLQDVIDFFDTYYVPSNLQLVVAGDFDPAEARPLIDRLFGAISEEPVPFHRAAPPNVVTEPRTVVTEDRVEHPRLHLVWTSPAYFTGVTASWMSSARS